MLSLSPIDHDILNSNPTSENALSLQRFYKINTCIQTHDLPTTSILITWSSGITNIECTSCSSFVEYAYRGLSELCLWTDPSAWKLSLILAMVSLVVASVWITFLYCLCTSATFLNFQSHSRSVVPNPFFSATHLSITKIRMSPHPSP